MPLKPSFLKKVGELGLIKGRTFNVVKAQISKNTPASQAKKDFTLVKRTVLRPQAGTGIGKSQLKGALNVLKRAQILKSKFRDNLPALLKEAKTKLSQEGGLDEKEKKEKLKKVARAYQASRRAEEEGQTSLAGQAPNQPTPQPALQPATASASPVPPPLAPLSPPPIKKDEELSSSMPPDLPR